MKARRAYRYIVGCIHVDSICSCGLCTVSGNDMKLKAL